MYKFIVYYYFKIDISDLKVVPLGLVRNVRKILGNRNFNCILWKWSTTSTYIIYYWRIFNKYIIYMYIAISIIWILQSFLVCELLRSTKKKSMKLQIFLSLKLKYYKFRLKYRWCSANMKPNYGDIRSSIIFFHLKSK